MKHSTQHRVQAGCQHMEHMSQHRAGISTAHLCHGGQLLKVCRGVSSFAGGSAWAMACAEVRSAVVILQVVTHCARTMQLLCQI
jgi:hypothetical protein